jgi:hypothetical protein
LKYNIVEPFSIFLKKETNLDIPTSEPDGGVMEMPVEGKHVMVVVGNFNSNVEEMDDDECFAGLKKKNVVINNDSCPENLIINNNTKQINIDPDDYVPLFSSCFLYPNAKILLIRGSNLTPSFEKLLKTVNISSSSSSSSSSSFVSNVVTHTVSRLCPGNIISDIIESSSEEQSVVKPNHLLKPPTVPSECSFSSLSSLGSDSHTSLSQVYSDLVFRTVCPILRLPFEEPVVAADGFTYEKGFKKYFNYIEKNCFNYFL